MTEPLAPLPHSLPGVPGRGTRKTFLIRLAKIAALLIVFACLFFAIRADLAKADAKVWHDADINWPLFALAGVCLGAVNTVQMVRYRSLLFAYGATPTWSQMVAIAWIPPLGKYVPGSVWALMGAIAMLRKFGINAVIAVSVVVMVDAFSEIVGLILCAPLFMRPPLSDIWPNGRWLAPLIIVGGIVALAPPVFGRLVQLGLRLIKRPPLERLPTWGEYIIPVLSAVAQWFFAGLALWLCARALADLSIDRLPWFIMIAACGMSIGYLAFIAPAGLGVREYIFVALLPALLPDAPAGTVTMVTLSMRLLQVLVELSLAGLGTIAMRRASEVPPEPTLRRVAPEPSRAP